MEIIVSSRQTKASYVLDLAFDLGMDRPRIATVEEWNGAQAYILTYGPPAYRKTAILRPSMTQEQVRETLMLAKAEEIPKPAVTTLTAATIENIHAVENIHEYTAKEWSPNEVETLKAKPQKRKAEKNK